MSRLLVITWLLVLSGNAAFAQGLTRLVAGYSAISIHVFR